MDIAVRYADAVESKAWGTGPGPSAGLRMQHQVFDKLVYAKVRAAMGGRVRHAMSGGSAMDRRLGLFFAGAGVTIYEGYGLTESTAAATANPPELTRFGTVGQAIPGTTVHIADDGEIWLSGGNVFQGYLNNDKATDATLHDGWLATGDLGSLDEDGYLTITGRKKEILVTSGGKSVSPGVLEERVRDHPLVAQCIVVGNDRPYIAALVTLDSEAVEHWLHMRGKPPLSARRSGARPGSGDRGAARRGRREHAGLTGRVDPHVPDTGQPVHRGTRPADAVPEAEAQGDREGVLGRGRGALPDVTPGGPRGGRAETRIGLRRKRRHD